MWRLTMRDRVFHRLSLVALGALSVGLLGWPVSTGAQTLGDITGTVGGTVGTVTGIVGGTTTVLGDTGTLAAGSLDSLYNEADSISTSLVSADVPSARVTGYADEIASESYLASLNLTIAGITITASSAEAEARAALAGTQIIATGFVPIFRLKGLKFSLDGR